MNCKIKFLKVKAKVFQINRQLPDTKTVINAGELWTCSPVISPKNEVP